jgi:tetratricopeptide (TPR) repeat protein
MNAFPDTVANAVKGGNVQVAYASSGEVRAPFRDDYLQALTRAIEELSANVRRLSSREEELMAGNEALLGAMSHLERKADESSSSTSMLLGAAGDLTARCRELVEVIRQLVVSRENQDLEAAQRAQRQLRIAGRLLDVVPLLARDLEPTSSAAEDAPETGESKAPQLSAESAESDRANVHRNRGLVLRDLGRFEEALAAFDQALALEPDDFATYRNRGLVLRDLGRLEEALSAFDQALGVNIGDTDVRERGNYSD